MMKKIYPRTRDKQTVYLNTVVKDLSIEVGDYTIYNDFASNPLLFEQNNVLYHSLINHERLIISRYSGYPYFHVNIGMRISKYTGINPTNGTQLTSCR